MSAAELIGHSVVRKFQITAGDGEQAAVEQVVSPLVRLFQWAPDLINPGRAVDRVAPARAKVSAALTQLQPTVATAMIDGLMA
jgi:hypothetical protein